MLIVRAVRVNHTVIDLRDSPLVEVNPAKLSGEPVLKGTRMPVAGVLLNHAQGLSAREIAEVFELPEANVRGLLEYAAERQAVAISR